MESNRLPNPELSNLKIRREARPGRGRRRRRWPILLALLAAGAVAWSLRAEILGLGPEVRTAVAERTGEAAGSEVLTANGYVTARRQAGVTPKVTGRIKVLYKDLGDRVSKDEVIAQLEDADILAGLEEARATMWVTQVTAERDRKLLEERIGTAADYDVSLARSKEAAARVKNLEEQVENTKVRAPFDGIIIVKNGEVGETVSLFGAQTSRKSGPIFVVADFHEFEVEADVNEARIGKVEPGQPARISLDAVPDRTYAGRLRQIVPTADRQKATVQVKVTLVDPDARVYPEMSAKVTFLRAAAGALPIRIEVPSEALAERGGKQVVFVLGGDGRVRETAVETAPAAGGRAEVKAGLAGGETIVLAPPPGLRDGSRVRPVSEPGPAGAAR